MYSESYIVTSEVSTIISHSLIHWFIQPFIHSFIHSVIHSFSHSVSHSLIQSFSHLVSKSFVRSFVRSFIHSFIEDNTWLRLDMEFLSECWTWYLTNECSAVNKWGITLNTREIPCLQAAMYHSVYYINLVMTTFLTIFLEYFRRLPRITMFRSYNNASKVILFKVLCNQSNGDQW